jgi:hypothetical protein
VAREVRHEGLRLAGNVEDLDRAVGRARGNALRKVARGFGREEDVSRGRKRGDAGCSRRAENVVVIADLSVGVLEGFSREVLPRGTRRRGACR